MPHFNLKELSKRDNSERVLGDVLGGVIIAIAALLLCISVSTPAYVANSQSDGTTSVAKPTTVASSASSNFEADEWDPDLAPNAYLVKGCADITFEGMDPSTFIYSGPDSLGRTGCAYACISKGDFDRESSEPREGFRSDADGIAGWGHNQKISVTWPDGDDYSGWALNRCHLIADSLGGMASADNLFTGTRFANTGYDNRGGMAYVESKVSEYLKSSSAGSFVYYRVTPAYVEDELVPRTIYMDILSNDGSIDEHVEVFNVIGDMNDVVCLDYSNGFIEWM